MVGSLWRYSHFLLATISAIFLLLASITGAILAFEPISNKLQPYAPIAIEDVYLSETIRALKNTYSEVLELEVTPEGFVKASIVTEEGKSHTIFVHPKTAEKLGDVPSPSPFFNAIKNLHRSLFLKSIGRAFVGIISFLLCCIAITGVFLLAKRQGGFKKWFNKVKETNIEQKYHVVLSRWLVLPILIIAATGTWLSAEKFALLPEGNLQQVDNVSNYQSETHFFDSISLGEVRTVLFPFSDDPEEFFEIKLKDRELKISQGTGLIESEIKFPFIKLINALSFTWHTGQGTILWSIVLLVASSSIVFFIYSGMMMSYKRLRTSKVLRGGSSREEAEYMILVGSETRSTFTFAKAFQKALLNARKTAHLSELNSYTTYAKADYLIIFTATYGDGDAPYNASNFSAIVEQITPRHRLNYAVVGFGSLRYPKYCQFAIEVDTLLKNHDMYQSLLALIKINEQSEIAFTTWVREWNSSTGMNLKVSAFLKKEKKKLVSFKVIANSGLNVDNTALLKLRPSKDLKFESGDLLDIIPPNETFPRTYSIAKIGSDILLSVKWHPGGICSTYLCTAKINQTIRASLTHNFDFRYPKNAPSVWMVANGTGIAPFLGMLNQKKANVKNLTWGGRIKESFDCYSTYINKNESIMCTLAFSQVQPKKHVQNVLDEKRDEVASFLKHGGVFMLCGSLKMQESVIKTLNNITTVILDQPLSDFENNKQLLMDCY
ncbi:PepSY domain-containing protein [Aquimarina sp. U1-2]|uniref:PepSY domain-containing protein n=1 Tax=Aquimarina sp. U1-2 TaxID=2823141 RepID=UPI001AECD25C|nr:PepSY domain-containing protein [Aquimarina sp. U1-2]MBP2832393.1 PepSY domain-containing protein [Aquimarina sp. U1-2]